MSASPVEFDAERFQVGCEDMNAHRRMASRSVRKKMNRNVVAFYDCVIAVRHLHCDPESKFLLVFPYGVMEICNREFRCYPAKLRHGRSPFPELISEKADSQHSTEPPRQA